MNGKLTTAPYTEFHFYSRNGYTSPPILIHQYRLLLRETDLLIDNYLSVECTI